MFSSYFFVYSFLICVVGMVDVRMGGLSLDGDEEEGLSFQADVMIFNFVWLAVFLLIGQYEQ